MTRVMVVLLMFFTHGEYGFSSLGVGAILGNGYWTQGQNHVALLQGSEISAGFHYGNMILGIQCFRLIVMGIH